MWMAVEGTQALLRPVLPRPGGKPQLPGCKSAKGLCSPAPAMGIRRILDPLFFQTKVG